MAYTFRQQFVPTSKHSLKCPHKMDAKYITIHNTANDASATNEVTYHNNNTNQVSYHIAVDDKEVVQCLPFDRNGWHCGDGAGANSGNRTSIGVEICYSKSGGVRYIKAEENAVHYVAKLLHERGWGVDRLRQHYDWSRKNCPHRIREEGRWQSFVQRIQKALDALKSPQVVAPNTPVKLTENQRKSARSIIRHAVKTKVFTSPHADVDTYSDAKLIEYTIVYGERTAK